MTPNRRMPGSLLLLPLALLAAGAASAAEPVAIVEDTNAADAGVAVMDYLDVGDVVSLRSGERLVLGFFASCIEETVTGGKVTVGARASTVAGGTVVRRKVDCDGGGLTLSDAQANSSGVIVFRNGATAANRPQPTARLFGLSPIVRSAGAGTLVITRLDAPAPAIEIAAAAGATDLARHGIALAPGGVYRAALDGKGATYTVVFEIDALARDGAAPALSRLLRM